MNNCQVIVGHVRLMTDDPRASQPGGQNGLSTGLIGDRLIFNIPSESNPKSSPNLLCRIERNVPAVEGLSLSDIFQVPCVENGISVKWLEEKKRAGRVLDDLYDEFSGFSEASEFEYNFSPEEKDTSVLIPYVDMLLSFLPHERHARITAVKSLLAPSQAMKAKSSAKKHTQAEMEHRENINVACRELVEEMKQDFLSLSNTGCSPWAELANMIVEYTVLSKLQDV